MPGAEVAFDTTVAIAILNGREDVARWSRGFDVIWLPVPVLGEFHFGAENSGKPEENLRRVDELAARCKVLILGEATARTYSTLRLDLKRKGKPIPENDLWIAAVCVEHDIPLATTDGHFREVSSLRILVPERDRPTFPSRPSA